MTNTWPNFKILLRFQPDLLHLMWFDNSSKKVNYDFAVKGQEEVTFRSKGSYYTVSQKMLLLLEEMTDEIHTWSKCSLRPCAQTLFTHLKLKGHLESLGVSDQYMAKF